MPHQGSIVRLLYTGADSNKAHVMYASVFGRVTHEAYLASDMVETHNL